MTRQKKIINMLLETAQYVCANPDAEVIVAVTKDNGGAIRTRVESTPITMLSVGVSMAAKSAVDEGLPLFALQELIREMYEDVRDGKDCVENENE